MAYYQDQAPPVQEAESREDRSDSESESEDEAEEREEQEEEGDVDDLELPPDVDVPSVTDLLRVATDVDSKIKDLEETPIAPRRFSDETKRNSAIDIPFDVLSTNNDVTEHSEQIEILNQKVNQFESRFNRIADTDLLIRNLVTKLDELTTTVHAQQTTITSLRADMTQFQTIISQTIQDVERRAATKQLSMEPKVPVLSIPPPDSVTVQRSSGPMSNAIPASTPAMKPRPKVADLSDF